MLTPEALADLRGIVSDLRVKADAVPFASLVKLGSQAELQARGVSIDLAASEELGLPLVVLHAVAANFTELTSREAEVAGLIVRGLSNKEIAARLVLSLGTVKDHVHHILQKTGMSNRAAIAARYSRS